MLLRTHVEVVQAMPFGEDLIHDNESGDGPVVWVAEQRITDEEARQLENDLNRSACAKGRQLTVCEILELVPFVRS